MIILNLEVTVLHKFMYSIRSNYTVNSSLYVTQCGYEDCAPGHSFGPVFRDHNLLHFVFSGKGTLEIADKKYHLEAGQGFLIPTGIYAKYSADDENPWHYGWMGFDGENALKILSFRGLSAENIIFSFENINQMNTNIQKLIDDYSSHGNDCLSIATMFEIFSQINPEHENDLLKTNIIDDAINYIERNYSNSINVNQIAGEYNLSRSQFFRVFKQKIGISPQQYLKQYRINHAADLLRQTDLSVEDIMRRSGFENACNFSKQFKSIYNRSPSAFREYVRRHYEYINK